MEQYFLYTLAPNTVSLQTQRQSMNGFLPPPTYETLKESLILMSAAVKTEMKAFVVVVVAVVKVIDVTVAIFVPTPSFL
jgi:hypothetical protein